MGNIHNMGNSSKKVFFTNSIEPAAYAVALPFYVSTTGINVLKKGNIHTKKGILSPNLELIWGLEGTGEITLYEKKYQLRENEVFYWLPGEDHTMAALSAVWRNRWLCLHGPLAEALLLSFHYPRLSSPESPYPAAIFQELEEAIGQNSAPLQRKICTLVMELLVSMGESGPADLHSGKIIPRCMDFIQANLADPALSVSMLSETLAMPVSTLTKLFRNETGTSPGRHIIHKRYSLAIKLLKGTDMRIAGVAERCGYPDCRTFAKFIRRISGCGPRELRSQLRQKDIPSPEFSAD